MRRQKVGEPVDSFITSLYQLAKHCNYHDLHDEMIQDWIVVGLQDSNLSERLQNDPELTHRSMIKYDHSGSVIAYHTRWYADSSIPFFVSVSSYITWYWIMYLIVCLLFNYMLYMISPRISQTEYNHENVANS